jgi:hypothetical protein
MKRGLLFPAVFALGMLLNAQPGLSQTEEPVRWQIEEPEEPPCAMFPDRFSDVILIQGKRVPPLLGQNIPSIRLMVWHHGRWEPAPFQIDEKSEDGSFLYPLGEENDQDKLDRMLACQDEVVFMARDAGCRVDPSDWPVGRLAEQEIEVTDPLTGEKGWFYLFSLPESAPLSPIDLIRYDPEYDRISSRYYEAGYARIRRQQKAVMEYYSVPVDQGGTGENWFDSAKLWTRIKLFFSIVKITIHSDDWVSWVPAYIDGPIRVVIKKRMYIKIGLGLHTPNVDADLAYYPYFFMSAIVISIPFDPALVTSYLCITIGTDLDHNAAGTLFWNSQNPDPVIVDGRMSPQERAMDLSPDRWRVVSGAQGKYLGKAVYGGNFKMSNIKLDEGRYVDDYTYADPPENEPGIFGSYNWTWDISNGNKGKYVAWIEAHYGPAIEKPQDMASCLNVTDHPLRIRTGQEERLNCLLVPPPGFTEEILPEAYGGKAPPAQEKPEKKLPERGETYGPFE